MTSEINLVMIMQLLPQQTVLKKQSPCQVLFKVGMFYQSQKRPKTLKSKNLIRKYRLLEYKLRGAVTEEREKLQLSSNNRGSIQSFL